MELPNELVVLLTGLLGAGVTWLVVEGFKGLSEALKVDLSKFATIAAAIVSASVVGTVVALLNAALSFVPVEYQPIVGQVLALLVMIFSAFGIQRRVKKSEPKG